MNRIDTKALPYRPLDARTAAEIFLYISGPKAILARDGQVIALTPDAPPAFRQALEALPPGAESGPGLLIRPIAAKLGKEAWRLVEPAPRSEAPDAAKLHDLRDMLHALGLSLQSESESLSAAERARHITLVATQLAEILTPGGEATSLDLGATLGDLCRVLEPRLHELGARLEVALPPQPLWIRTDRSALLRLVQNLLLNAGRESGGGRVSINLSAKPADPGVEIAVTVDDDGPGLPTELGTWLRTANDLAGSAPPPRDGHGYGLSIIREAARTLGARLDVNHGVRHSITARFAAASTLPPPAAAQSAARARLAGRRIWLGEDNAVAGELLAQALRREGADIRLFSCAEALLQTAVAEPDPDLLLCDYYLADQTGAELARQLRDAGFAAPILALTAESDPGIRAIAFCAGMSDVLYKPLSADKLVASLVETLATRPKDAMPQIFDPEVAGELFEDAGVATATKFMQRALTEARDITPLCRNGEFHLARAALHSAIGASAITGLYLVANRLRLLQSQVANAQPWQDALSQLEAAITETSQAISKIDQIPTKTAPPV